MRRGFTAAQRAGQAADLDDKLGAPPRLVFFGTCLCEQLIVEFDDGSMAEWPSRRNHVCPGPRREPVPLPLAAPERAPQAAEASHLGRPRPRGVLDLGD